MTDYWEENNEFINLIRLALIKRGLVPVHDNKYFNVRCNGWKKKPIKDTDS